MVDKSIDLPKLPYGEGSMSWMPNKTTIMYKKKVGNKREVVYAETPREAIQKMKDKEKISEVKIKHHVRIQNKTEMLESSMIRWLTVYKMNQLKASSFDRLESTLKNQIFKFDIAKREVQSITSEMIQEHINFLIKENLSYSIVKKTYETFNQFFNYTYLKDPYNNPMLSTIKPTRNAMNKRDKEVDFFEPDDIELFVNGVTETYKNGKLIYKLGWGLVGILYTGLRINEALSLKWSNFDFENNILEIKETASRIIDRDLSTEDNPIYKIIYTTPKTHSGIRILHLTENARIAFLKLKTTQIIKSTDDFVFATDSGKPDGQRNLRRTLNNVQKKMCMTTQNSGLHVLRHTFCSLLVRNNVDKRVIADLMGQSSTDMIERIYQHVTKKEKIEATQKINDISHLQLNIKS